MVLFPDLLTSSLSILARLWRLLGGLWPGLAPPRPMSAAAEYLLSSAATRAQ